MENRELFKQLTFFNVIEELRSICGKFGLNYPARSLVFRLLRHCIFLPFH